MAEAGKHGDELAQTATAPGTSDASSAATPLGDTLGRYRLERTLGEGGMGVVHCAFDPDLERRVAVKVLRRSDGHDARQRLLREARAMARLTHPNVVAVHEVGTAGDRDFVAMELIDGETLADWRKAERRSAHEITQAFIAAGRGLAAAHSAGLVHRDFKPHNVLCARDGRVVVTDFGLARGVDAAMISFETTLRPDQAPEASPSSLTGLTATGSVLGTPAYMAPEQWNGGVVGPAADQFAFCVALWEALAGERPFKGQTLDELKRDVQRGGHALDDSKVPRRLRAPLRRGLSRDPAARFPSMDALLAALARADRRSSALSITWRAVLVIGTLAFVFLGERAGHLPVCEPPAVALGDVWSPAISAGTPAALVVPFDKLAVRWATARATACTAAPAVREEQLHCLDGALARFSAVRQAFSRVAGATAEMAAGELVDPTVCLAQAPPPRLALAATRDAATAFEMLAGADAAGDGSGSAMAPQIQAFANRADVDPCARTIALRALSKVAPDFNTGRAALGDAVQGLDLCDDDRVRADVLIAQMPLELELPNIGARGEAAVKRAANAVARVAQVNLSAHVDGVRAVIEREADRWDDALALQHHIAESLELDGYHVHAVDAALDEIETHFIRSQPEDYVAARAQIARWIPVAQAAGDAKHLRDLARDDAYARYMAGDLSAHADLARAWADLPLPPGPHMRIEGDVVDAAGRPVAGAQVSTALRLTTDSIGVLPWYPAHWNEGTLRQTTSDEHGHFAIDGAPPYGVIVAQAGELRSNPIRTAGHVKLVVAPTRTLAGKVALGSLTHTEVVVLALTSVGDAYAVIGFVKPDGTFALSGVPTTKIGVAAVNSKQLRTTFQPQQVAAGAAPIANLALQPPASTGRTLDVLVRSTLTAPIETAEVVVVGGHVKIANAGELNAMIGSGIDVEFARSPAGERTPRPALDQVKPGDLWARFADVSLGALTVCSIALPASVLDETAMRKMMAHMGELALACVPIDGDAKVVVVPTAPPKRID